MSPDDIDWDVTPPPPTSAFDRLQTRTVTVARSSRRRLPESRRTLALVAGIALLVIVAATTMWWLRREEPLSDRDLLVRLAAVAEDFQPSVATANPNEAEAYVSDVFGWPIGVPAVSGMALVGVGEASLSPALSVPAFRFGGADGEATVFAYDYVFLGQAESTFDLPEATYAQLAEPDPVDSRRLGDAYLVTWRHRAVVYTAVTNSEDAFERLGRDARQGQAGAGA